MEPRFVLKLLVLKCRTHQHTCQNLAVNCCPLVVRQVLQWERRHRGQGLKTLPRGQYRLHVLPLSRWKPGDHQWSDDLWTLLQGDYRQLVHEQDQYQYWELRLMVLDIRSTYVRTLTVGCGRQGPFLSECLTHLISITTKIAQNFSIYSKTPTFRKPSQILRKTCDAWMRVFIKRKSRMEMLFSIMLFRVMWSAPFKWRFRSMVGRRKPHVFNQINKYNRYNNQFWQ